MQRRHALETEDVFLEKKKGKVNQLDVGNKKEEQNSDSNNPRTSKNSKNKTNWRKIRASDKNHSALRTRKQQ